MKPDRKKRYKSLPLMVLSQIVLIALAVLIIYPLFFVLMTSFKSNYDVLVNPFGIKTFQPENYVQAWRIGMIGKLKPWGSPVLEIVYMFGLFVTSEMITIPNFVTLKAWGLGGTRASLILPYVTNGLAMATFIMTAFVKSLPTELDEAAMIDGASILDNLIKITLPLSVPGIISGISMVFLPAMTNYVILDMLYNSTYIMGSLIGSYFSAYNWNGGSMISLVLLAMICIFTLLTGGGEEETGRGGALL